MKTKRACAALSLAAALSAAAPAAAQEIGERRPIEDNSGAGVSASPSAYFPSHGNTGLGVDAQATYGIPISPAVVAPGGRFAAYLGGNGAVTGMPMVEAMLPVGQVVPYVKAGAGIGHATGPNESGLALMGGAGVKVHLNRQVAVGVDASYEGVAGTSFRALSIGPSAELRY